MKQKKSKFTKVFNVGMQTNLTKLIEEKGGKEFLDAVHLDGDLIQTYEPIFEVTVHRDKDWSPEELVQLKEKIKETFTQQYSKLLIQSHTEFYIKEEE